MLVTQQLAQFSQIINYNISLIYAFYVKTNNRASYSYMQSSPMNKCTSIHTERCLLFIVISILIIVIIFTKVNVVFVRKVEFIPRPGSG
jgi:hypothetical protein